SQYNDGKGLKLSVSFNPLEVPGPKHCKNAKLTVITKVIYIHEEFTLKDMIAKDLFQTSWLYNNCELDGSDSATFKYTAHCSQDKDIFIKNEVDFAEMVAAIEAAKKPEARLSVTENKENCDDPADEDDEDKNEPSCKKQKKHVLSPEESAQDEHIKNLQNKYRCEDRQCPYNLCWPSALSGDHIHLTHKRLQTWAAAL
ncbi:hypothetical protein PAXRUDRAFT_120432, partial [Paxillus rubicundulus Ve08.2h10]